MRNQQIPQNSYMSKIDKGGLFTAEGLCPQLTIQVADEELGLLGYLVIDRLLDGRALGGIRMTSNLTLAEIVHLARAMTLKFSFINIGSVGGAKAGVIIQKSLSRAERTRILAAFGRHLGPLIRCGLYTPSEDLGISYEDILVLKQAAGLDIRSNMSKGKKSAYYTSLTVFVAAERLANGLGLKLADCSVAIEGFGRVGSSVAELFSEAGARIVAISTTEGGLYNPKGLGVKELIILKGKVGDRVVKEYRKGEAIEREKLLTLEVDILIPCAGAWTINSRNVNQLKTQLVVPGANIPVTADAEQTMFKMGIHYLPDFVCNCGGVLGNNLEWRGFNEQDIKKIIRQEFGRKVLRIIELAQMRNLCPTDIAREISKNNFRKMEERAKKRSRRGIKQVVSKVRQKGLKNILLQIAADAFRLNLIPKGLLRPLVYEHVRNMLRADDEAYS